MTRHPACELYTKLLKSCLITSRGLKRVTSRRVDMATLLGETRQRFGDELVCGLTAESLGWLLDANARDADTLAPPTHLDVLQSCIEAVVDEAVPGDFVEAGCFRGGQCVLMSGVLKALDDSGRTVFAADSFGGLPEPDPRQSPDDAVWYHLLGSIGRFGATLGEFEDTLNRYGLLHGGVRPVAGWFRASLPDAAIESLAVIRLDCTFYQSTFDTLEILYPKLSKGGFVISADYGAPTGARRAVDKYRVDQGIDDPLIRIDGQGVLWRRAD